MTMFMVNPPARQKRRKSGGGKRRRSPAQIAATKKMIAARKRKLSGVKRARPNKRRKARTTQMEAPRMARRKKKVTRRSPARRRRSSARRTSVKRYRSNPVRRVRRRVRHHRNPSIMGQLRQGVMDAGATLVGGALARTASGLIPLPNTGLTGAAVGLGVALGIGMAARKVVSADTARFLTAGAMQVPLKSLITTFVPQAGAFLGDYDNIGTYALPGGGVAGYLDSVSDPSDYGRSDMSSYVEAYQ